MSTTEERARQAATQIPVELEEEEEEEGIEEEEGKAIPQWHVSSSVLASFWGGVMPRLAAAVWSHELYNTKPALEWPPKKCPHNYTPYPIKGQALKKFWNGLAFLVFPHNDADPDNLAKEYKRLREDLDVGVRDGARFSDGQRQAHEVLNYFDPDGSAANRMLMRVIREEAYDFILHARGLDVFVPPKPWDVRSLKAVSIPEAVDYSTLVEEPDLEEEREISEEARNEMKKKRILTRRRLLRTYKIRNTGHPPIAIPGGRSKRPIPTIQMAAPTGVSWASPKWFKRRYKENEEGNWYLTGSIYRGIMAELPKLIAALWYEVELFDAQPKKKDTYFYKFENDGLKSLVAERIETALPENFKIKVAQPEENPGLPRWDPKDIMITQEGMTIPSPWRKSGGNVVYKSPDTRAMLGQIMSGLAGNPVFTDTLTCE
jgi:hypothetical protein